MRKKVVAGNWKMNLTKTETISFIKEIKQSCDVEGTEVIFFVPDINILPALEEVKGTNINIGCQNMHFADKGAFTGDISGDMLLDVGIKYVLVGHSERREYYKESDEQVNLKVKKALEKGIVPVLCVGENLDQREDNITKEVVRIQIKKGLKDVSNQDLEKVIIAYEPVWAIGTGKTATALQADEVCREIRETIKEIYNESLAKNISILYGGSVNKDNAMEIFAMEDIDGGLVGGASLKADFSQVILA